MVKFIVINKGRNGLLVIFNICKKQIVQIIRLEEGHVTSLNMFQVYFRLAFF